DEAGAGEPEAFLAAEMIGDRGDVGVGRSRDLARRGAVEALLAEQLQTCADQGRAGLLGLRRRLFPSGGFGVFRTHEAKLINRLIKVNRVERPGPARLIRPMAIESERKFLVASDAWRESAGDAVAITQFYVFAAPDRSARVRL